MTLDTSGALLEGARYSTGNSVYTFPPDSVLVDAGALSAATERAEYVVVAGSLDAAKHSLEIADPDLVFYWSRNEPGVTRFDYDDFSGRWLPMPGLPPRAVGSLSNEERLTIPVPDPTRLSAPYDLYIDGSPRTSFTLIFIGSAAFSNPDDVAPLHSEVNSGGQLNFSAVDAASRAGQPVVFTGQSFASRLQSKGNIGTLPDFASTDYRIFLNPRPAAGQIPLLRIGYGPYLRAEAVATESALSPPPPGTVRWSEDTGRLKFADEDVTASPGDSVYYDGAFLGVRAFDRTDGIHAAAAWPNAAFTIPAAVNNASSARFVIFVEKAGEARRYFGVSISSGVPARAPAAGWASMDSATGHVYLAPSDVAKYASWTFGHLDARLELGAPGAAVLMRRSGVNGIGPASASDFTIAYEVSQLLTDNLPPTPFMMLPTTPLVDSGLQFLIEMGSGKYVGPLRDASDAAAPGYGYILDLDTKRLKFARRASPQQYTLAKEQSSVKLDGAALHTKGVSVKRDGVQLSASDFDLDAAAGLIEFVEPVGEGDVGSRDVAGQASGATFTVNEATFTIADHGKRFLVLAGANSGIRDIVAVNSGLEIEVNPPFAAAEAVAGSIRATDEIVADRIWAPISSVPKKFSILRSPSGPAGVFTKMNVGEYQVKSNVGQVNLISAALPGEAIRIQYISLDSEDEGVTVTPTSRVEMAMFKIRQETPTFAVGSKVITFNSAGKTVDLGRPIELFIDGVTQEPTSYAFVAPGTLVLKDAVPAGPVTVNYWVQEASGGETTIDLLHSPVDYDNLKVTGPVPGGAGGSEYIEVGGDQTATLKEGGAILAESKDVLYIAASSYDSATDLTRVTFAQPAVDDSESIRAADIIRGTYQAEETNPVEIFVAGTTAIRIHADVRLQYVKSTVVDLDGDPYWTLGAAYDAATGITTVTTAGRARRNYITPVVRRTVRPVHDPGSNFSTARPAYTARGFVLAKMGARSAVLKQGVDYDLGEDGVISLKAPVVFGDVLRAVYVARVPQPVGTVFELNFAYEIAPDDSNGLAGQQLRMNYNLYAPDSFFYRVETVVSMLPEAKAAATASSSASSSGPNIASTPSKQTKDAGLPSPWYDSMHYQNLDAVVQRYLKFYHDLIENYEDVLQLIDGRRVGGSSGRFRYDGKLDNAPRLKYEEITNDIDDRVKLYDAISMSPGFPPSVAMAPVYGKMSEPNNLSRIFPTTCTGASFTDSTSSAANGQPVGSFKVSSITAVGTTTTARATAFFTSATLVPGGTKLMLDAAPDAPELFTVLCGGVSTNGTNGDSDTLTPPFVSGMKVQVFDLVGNKVADGTVGPDADSTHITLDVTVSIQIGSVAQTMADWDGDRNQQNMYTPGLDYLYAPDSGQIFYYKLPSFFPIHNTPLAGSETLEAPISFQNAGMKPIRVPALDGKETNDSGRLQVPRVRTQCELQYLASELSALRVGVGKHPAAGPSIVVEAMYGQAPMIGQTVQFIDGPNAGFIASVVDITSIGFNLNPAPLSPDPSGSSFVVGSLASISTLLNKETNILNSELAKLDVATASFGNITGTGTGTAAGNTWTASADLSGSEGKLLWVTSGPSRGLWKIQSAAGHVAIVSTDSYPALVAGSGAYSIIDPWVFLQEVEFQFAASFYRSTLQFLQSTVSWSGFISAAGTDSRRAAIQQRQSDLAFVAGPGGSLTALLRDGDNLYDTRYLWIDQRTNRESGLMQMQARSAAQALEIITKVTENQRKALLLDAMAKM